MKRSVILVFFMLAISLISCEEKYYGIPLDQEYAQVDENGVLIASLTLFSDANQSFIFKYKLEDDPTLDSPTYFKTTGSYGLHEKISNTRKIVLYPDTDNGTYHIITGTYNKGSDEFFIFSETEHGMFILRRRE